MIASNQLKTEAVERIKIDVDEEEKEELSILIYLLIGAGVIGIIAGTMLGVLRSRKKDDERVEGTTGFIERD